MVNIKGAVKLRLMSAAMLASMLVALASFAALGSPILAVVGFVTALEIVYFVTSKVFLFAHSGAKHAPLTFVSIFWPKERDTAVFALEGDSTRKMHARKRTKVAVAAPKGAVVAAEFRVAVTTHNILSTIMRLVIAPLAKFSCPPLGETVSTLTKSVLNHLRVSAWNRNRLITPATFDSHRATFPGRRMLAVVATNTIGKIPLLRIRNSFAVLFRSFLAGRQVTPGDIVRKHPVADGSTVNIEAQAKRSERLVLIPV